MLGRNWLDSIPRRAEARTSEVTSPPPPPLLLLRMQANNSAQTPAFDSVIISWNISAMRGVRDAYTADQRRRRLFEPVTESASAARRLIALLIAPARR